MKRYILAPVLLAAVMLAGCASEKSCPGWPGDSKTDAGVHAPASAN